MKILRRTEFGNPILRKKAKKVALKTISTASFQKLVQQMVYTMRKVEGVGLAAPQIGKGIQLAVMETRPTKTRPTLKRSDVVVAVNPRITYRSKETAPSWEGCLSCEGIRGKVPRAKTIAVTYYDECGEKVTAAASGLWAAIFQHEIDHLNGITFLDRMKDMKTLMTVDEFRKRV